jgi:hypothetical protein
MRPGYFPPVVAAIGLMTVGHRQAAVAVFGVGLTTALILAILGATLRDRVPRRHLTAPPFDRAAAYRAAA